MYSSGKTHLCDFMVYGLCLSDLASVTSASADSGHMDDLQQAVGHLCDIVVISMLGMLGRSMSRW